jgi:hypothetical protein
MIHVYMSRVLAYRLAPDPDEDGFMQLVVDQFISVRCVPVTKQLAHFLMDISRIGEEKAVYRYRPWAQFGP